MATSCGSTRMSLRTSRISSCLSGKKRPLDVTSRCWPLSLREDEHRRLVVDVHRVGFSTTCSYGPGTIVCSPFSTRTSPVAVSERRAYWWLSSTILSCVPTCSSYRTLAELALWPGGVLWSALCAARAGPSALVRCVERFELEVRRDVRVRVGCCAVGRLAYSFFIVCDCSEFEELLGFVLCKEPACALPWCRRLSLCMSTGRHSSSPVVTKLTQLCRSACESTKLQ